MYWIRSLRKRLLNKISRSFLFPILKRVFIFFCYPATREIVTLKRSLRTNQGWDKSGPENFGPFYLYQRLIEPLEPFKSIFSLVNFSMEEGPWKTEPFFIIDGKFLVDDSKPQRVNGAPSSVSFFTAPFAIVRFLESIILPLPSFSEQARFLIKPVSINGSNKIFIVFFASGG